LQDSIRFLDFSVPDSTYIMIYIALIVFGLVIGFLGSMLAMRRYLKV
jgi:cell division transport system permease protein